jgi:hypothetical protein
MFNDALNRFAVAQDGSWVASHGDLGLAVWSRSGELLWKQDKWKEANSKPRWTGIGSWTDARLVPPFLTAVGKSTLLVADQAAATATAYDAASGKQSWQVALPSGAEISKAIQSDDGKTLALSSTAEGGRVFLLQGGKLIKTVPVSGTDFDLSPDGSTLAVVNSTQLKTFGPDGGLRWVLNGDEFLLNPRIAADGRVAVSSRIGTLYVLDNTGKVLLQKDAGALVAPTWLPGGDLLTATWLGRVTRLDPKGVEKWDTELMPSTPDMRGKMLAADTTPTARVADSVWTNNEKTALPLGSNILLQAEHKVYLHINQPADKTGPEAPNYIADGKPDALDKPLVEWGNLNWLADATAENWITIEFPFHRAKVDAITFAEDPQHPESWIRDAYLEFWDDAKKEWAFVAPLMSNGALHTHLLPRQISAQKFRVMLPPGVVGNVRLGEIALHGTVEDVVGSQVVWDEDEKIEEVKDKFFVTENPQGVKPQSGQKVLRLQAVDYGNMQVAITNSAAWTNSKKFTGYYFVPANQPDNGQLSFRLLTTDLDGAAASQAWEDMKKPMQLKPTDRGKWVKFAIAKSDFEPQIPGTPVKIGIIRARYIVPEAPDHYVLLDNLRIE